MECGVCGNEIETGELHCSDCFSLVQNDFLDEEIIMIDEIP